MGLLKMNVKSDFNAAYEMFLQAVAAAAVVVVVAAVVSYHSIVKLGGNFIKLHM